MVNFIKARAKEVSSLHGGALIAIGLIILFASPIAKLAAYASSLGVYGQFGRKTNQKC